MILRNISTTEHVATTPIAVPTEDTVRVETTAGPVRGLWREIVSHPERSGPESRRTRSAAFYAIPYAEEPTGQRRFMAPVRRAPWEGELEAYLPGPTPQRGSIFDDPAIPEPSVPGDDVLTLNVFTPVPGQEDARLPVFVWIHGGGWTSGSHNSPWYDGAAFNRDGVVTVSVAYRLGFDGYGYVEGSDAPFNRAVLDQVMALEWVRDNIARFGGDPARVTIGGQSAGGGNSMVLMTVPRAKGLFRAVISQSGAVTDMPADLNRERARAMAAALGVEPTLDGLRTVSYDEVFAAQNALTAQDEHADDGGAAAAGPDPVAAVAGRLAAVGKPDTGISFSPTVDGEIVPVPVAQALREGRGAGIAVLAGSTTHDFAFSGFAFAEAMAGRDVREVLVEGGLDEALADRLLAAHPEHAEAGHLILGDLISDTIFHCQLVSWLLARGEHAASGARAGGSWAYEFSYTGGQMGLAAHCMDVPFSFDCLLEPYCEGHTLPGGAPQALADAVHGAWVRFIETGGCDWEQWVPRSVGRRFGDNRSGALVVAEDRVVFDTDRDIVTARS
ncbi:MULTISPECIES: carboxylesterase family protein [unclassified Actinomyces]|uniref:carboxylesterase/lipase family protein n=1 Tax=unclassified Actinomyces TaxID=2609248 RepID=UPI002016C00D|nr:MULTISPECIES: carboxylesterase family protein [unclassified Actinomyces]MCL3778441.1 carboxylesterase family protein [Actinomyces sp. AC-20-1]MCL3790749.1 carboxylesterase family protein [Actinomyces sp. 187325]MCL3793025.1 carboxylesterase family protein [Actinomyces sp. 186855]MCL3794574.1 carboxylesterase family protein [Actinomyces sp. 217892]